jgi:hypothetical protein
VSSTATLIGIASNVKSGRPRSDVLGGWPTGEPREPKGDLGKFVCLLGRGHRRCGTGELLNVEDDKTEEDQTESDVWSKSFDVSQTLANIVGFNQSIADGQRRLAEAAAAAEAACERVRSMAGELKRRETALAERKRLVAAAERRLEAVSAELTNRRQRVDAERSRVDRERDAVDRLRQMQASRIRLDVGGTVFETSRRTMIDRDPTSLLAAMFADDGSGGEVRLKPETDGSYFVDRDGAYFRYVIEYLRNGAAASMPADIATARHVLCEAKFYRLRQLVKRIEDWLVERNASIV